MIIAEKLGNDVSSLPSYESHYKEGDTGELIVYLHRPLDYEELEQMKTEIKDKGINLEYIQQDAKMLIIGFRKQSFPLTVIVGALISVAAVILGWQLFKAVSTIPAWAWILGGVVGTYCVIRLIRRNK